MLNRNVVKILNTKDVKSLGVGFLKGKKALCVYRHISALGARVCVILLSHSMRSPSGCAGNTKWVIGLLRERIFLLFCLFFSIYSSALICFTNLSLEFSFLKYWMKPGFSWPTVWGSWDPCDGAMWRGVRKGRKMQNSWSPSPGVNNPSLMSESSSLSKCCKLKYKCKRCRVEWRIGQVNSGRYMEEFKGQTFMVRSR